MKRSLYILTVVAILTGCGPEFKDTNGTMPNELKASVEQEHNTSAVKSESSTPESDLSSITISEIAGKPEADVTALLGKPTATETGEWTSLSTEEKTPFVRHTYKADTGEISVMFIEGVAARIEVRPSEAFKYPDDAIKAMRAVGLTVEDGVAPERENPLYLDFGRVDDFYNVRVVKDVEGNPENVGYVKIVTESRFK
ncbi:hypothetical protein [Brevibacillus porteri]|uniref:Lipoprotein n=1 Tax=Brevibacillus porteri TaxID=2126350 RepID=A0ABX5FKQ2_9BACL|nr:hypothetical protein [Brevibacillus porteri]MED1802927.1 hypothetical protein [Brevibacillus porteri]MED2135103.1 hypothetical protein [Brevibacillus porteri]MED2746345.1 hypothetical protein [Brevibacillus porteri]MED2817929.1 hypothetical protein [Brevibacillus porteri]MED2895561.1 hypothetical protein [Brevibacillus porteri]